MIEIKYDSKILSYTSPEIYTNWEQTKNKYKQANLSVVSDSIEFKTAGLNYQIAQQ